MFSGNVCKITNGLLTVFVLCALMLLVFNPSDTPTVLGYSRAKFALILLLFVLLTYLIFSYKSDNLMKIHTGYFFSALLLLCLIEVFLRLGLAYLPPKLAALLPPVAREAFAKQTARLAENNTDGSGMLYHFKPNTVFSNYPWVKIDSLGYRNPIETQPNSKVDAVLLGDSVTIALDSKYTLDDYLRKNGQTAVNFAMGGYTIQHYQEAFQKWVIDRNISFRVLIVGVCMVNDIPDTKLYNQIKNANQDWRAYLGQVPRYYEYSYLPWSVGFIANLVLYVKDVYIDNPHKQEITEEKTIEIKTSYLHERHAVNILQPDYFPPDSIDWQEFIKGLQNIAALARDQKAEKVVFLLMPAGTAIYYSHIYGNDKMKELWMNNYRDLTKRIESSLQQENTLVLDTSGVLAAKAEQLSVSSDNGSGYHLNHEGVRAVFELLAKNLAIELKN